MFEIHSFLNLIGGPVVAALIALSIVATTFIFARLLRSIWAMLDSKLSGETVLTKLQAGEAITPNEIKVNSRNPRIANIYRTWQLLTKPSITSANKGNPNNDNYYASDKENLSKINNEVMRELRNHIQRLSFGLRPLEVIATVAPLLGLFGTVLGMIEAFKAMEAAGAQVDPAVLSGGIWQALLTTAVGLGVAIPVSLIHSLFERQHESLSLQMLSDSETLLNNIPNKTIVSKTLKAVRA